MGSCPTVLGYLGASGHWVCQEYPTKWECLFSALFSRIAWCLLIDLWFLQDLFIWMAIGRMLLTWKDWSTRQQGPSSLAGADRGLQCWLGCPDCLCRCNSFVGILGWADKRAGRGEWDFVWLSIDKPPLRSLGPASQCTTDGSAVQHSCLKLL